MSIFLPLIILFHFPERSTAWQTGFSPQLQQIRRQRNGPLASAESPWHSPSSDQGDSSSCDEHNVIERNPLLSTNNNLRTYNGPILQDPAEIVTGVSLVELGLDLVVAPSTVASGTLGLYAILSENVDRTTVPAMTLLCGYSRKGKFQCKDEGDKTVGFTLAGSSTAVFYERQLMSIMDALQLAAETVGKEGACGLAGHILEQKDNDDNDGSIQIRADSNPEFARYFVPALLNRGDEDDGGGVGEDTITVQNLGQFCNDLAWSYDNPPKSKEEYDSRSLEKNAVQLVWRVEFDETLNSFVPTWPVSVLAEDMIFCNNNGNGNEFMELGTRYGWSYWQATVDMDVLN